MTTFEHYMAFFWRKMPVLLLVSLLAALIAYGICQRLGPTYEAHFSYLVSLSQRESASDFRFDGYYAISATDLFAGTLASWTQAPEVIVQAFAQAQLPLPGEDARALSKIVQAQKAAPQLVQVIVRSRQKVDAQKIAEALQRVMSKNVEQYHEQGIPAVQFRVVASVPWIGVSRPATTIVVVAAFMIVFLISLNSLLLIESFKRV